MISCGKCVSLMLIIQCRQKTFDPSVQKLKNAIIPITLATLLLRQHFFYSNTTFDALSN